jgi:fluoroacetyl-CoA thioesterase
MREIPLGAKGTFTLRVLPEHLANRFKDAMLPQVLATPVMVLMMENAALNAIRPYLDPGESAVGTAIDVRHLAATPVAHEVRAEAEVIKAEGKHLEFDHQSRFVQRAPCRQKQALAVRSENLRRPRRPYGRLDKIRAFLQFATAFKRRRQSDVAYFNPRFFGGWRWILDRRAGPARQYADDLTVR